MFWFRKKDNTRMLDKIDDVYILCLERKDPSYFIKYSSKEVYRMLLTKIKSGNIDFYGIPKYRTRTWELTNVNGSLKTYVKKVEHDNVRVFKNVAIPVGDFVREIWTVDTSTKIYTIVDIRR